MIRVSLAALPILLATACGPAEEAAAPIVEPAVVAVEAQAEAGPWTVDGETSRVSFVSVKASEIAEVHYFSGLSGEVSDSGAARIAIDLNSVETAILIRNDRMREILFETETFPEAVVSADLDLTDFDSLAIGDRSQFELSATISLHGQDADITPDVYVTRASDDRVVVETVDPIIVYAYDFGLESGLAQLQELANLPSIAPAVPVTFSIALKRTAP
ncbi:MAG: YceI family protein [Pseudomonadota bacterium]